MTKRAIPASWRNTMRFNTEGQIEIGFATATGEVFLLIDMDSARHITETLSIALGEAMDPDESVTAPKYNTEREYSLKELLSGKREEDTE